MASKPSAAPESSETFDDSWVVVDDSVMKNDEIDENVLNPMSAKARSMNNLKHKLRKLKQKTSSSTIDRELHRKSQEYSGQEQKSGVVGIIRRMRSKSSTTIERGVKGEKRMRPHEG